MEKTRKWRWGVNRWIVLLFIVAGAFAAKAFPPLSPHIQVAPENLSQHPLFSLPIIGDFYLTNTLVGTFIVFILIMLLAYFVNRSIKKGDMVPKGVSGAVEAVVEMGYNVAEGTAGKHTKSIFPFFATIVIFVLFANWFELLPGVDSIGLLEHSEHGYAAQMITSGIGYIIKGEQAAGGYSVVPFVRVPSTDLNFTAALALISVGMTQIIGLRVQGPRYLTKFFNFTTLFSKPLFGAIDLAVGLLETISEFSKILSFSFRLFGNIFAGSVLLFLVGSMVPIFAQSAVLLFEFFIGLIQAFVFGMLTLVFMTMATQGHSSEEHAEANE